MKTIFAFLLFCSTSFALVHAQPLLDPEMFPLEGIAGAWVQPNDTLNSNEGPVGADIFWDFDHWTPNLETSLDWFTSDLDYLTNEGAFTDASLGQEWYDTIFREEYYQKTPASLSLVGIWSQDQALVYSDYELLLLANMAYNDTFADVYRAQRQGSDYDYVLEGEKWTTYDAYGTLKIQGNAIPNTIRLRTEQTWRDTFYYDNGSINLKAYNRTSYRWYNTFKCGPDVAIHYTTKHEENWLGGVLVDSFSTPQTIHKTMLSWCIHVGTKEPNELAGILFELSGANPVQDILNCVITSEFSGRNLQLQLFDPFGRLVAAQKITTMGGEETLKIPVDHLATGVYVVSLSDGKGRVSRRWVKM